MNAQNRAKRQMLKNMRTLSEYAEYADSLKLTEEQRNIMDMVFVRGWNYKLIADTLGYQEDTIKRKMRKILDKL